MNGKSVWSRVLLGMMVVAVLALTAGCSASATTGSGALLNTGGTRLAGETDNVRRIAVNGSGQAFGTPDVAYIQLGVNTLDRDSAKAVADNTQAMNAVIEAVKASGVEDKDIQTVAYNMWVEQEYDKDGIPTGVTRLHIDNQVRITLREPANTGAVITAALEAGANTVNSISFGVLDTTALQKQAREAAIAQAKERAEQLAAGFGAKVGALRMVSEYSSMPVADYGKVEAAAYGRGGDTMAVTVQSGQFVVTVDIQVEFLID